MIPKISGRLVILRRVFLIDTGSIVLEYLVNDKSRIINIYRVAKYDGMPNQA